MSRSRAGPRCEVCAARLDPDTPANRPRRCVEHLAQQALFPLAAVPGRRRRVRSGPDDLSPRHDRHHATTGRRARRDRSGRTEF